MKFKEVEDRLFKNIYVCRKCKSKIRVGNPAAIKNKKAKCRKCGYKELRPKKKEVTKKG